MLLSLIITNGNPPLMAARQLDELRVSPDSVAAASKPMLKSRISCGLR
jgi:hypothetical protein